MANMAPAARQRLAASRSSGAWSCAVASDTVIHRRQAVDGWRDNSVLSCSMKPGVTSDAPLTATPRGTPSSAINPSAKAAARCSTAAVSRVRAASANQRAVGSNTPSACSCICRLQSRYSRLPSALRTGCSSRRKRPSLSALWMLASQLACPPLPCASGHSWAKVLVASTSSSAKRPLTSARASASSASARAAAACAGRSSSTAPIATPAAASSGDNTGRSAASKDCAVACACPASGSSSAKSEPLSRPKWQPLAWRG